MKRICLPMLALVLSPAVLSAESLQTMNYQAQLTPSLENPSATADASGNASIAIHVRRDDEGKALAAYVDFNIHYELGQPQTLLAMHIHKALPGVNGPVVISGNLGTSISADVGPGRIFRQTVVDTESGLAVVEDILKNPGNYYFNMHSAANPGGIVRVQLEPVEQLTLLEMNKKLETMAADLSNVELLLTKLAAKAGFVPYPVE